MDTFAIKNLTFSYPRQEKRALDGLSLTVRQGEFLTLCGLSGCGKSTLLRHLKTALAPHGTKSGKIIFEDKPLEETDEREQSARIGFVFQNPDNQIVTDKVWHELAFGLESLGCDTPTIRRRVAEMASFFGIQTWFYKDVTELSGGQKQLLNLAAIMAMQPSVLILDEPTSQLDPIAAADFIAVVGRINRELGTTIIMTEHRLEEVFPLSSRVLVMDKGRLICEGTPQEVGERLKDDGNAMFLAMPTPMRVYAAVANELNCPVTVRDGRDWLTRFSKEHPLSALPIDRGSLQTSAEASPAVLLDDVWFRYEKDQPDVVKGLSLTVKRGEFLAILGGNGTGKTTALSLIGGLNKPYRGKVVIEGKAPSITSGGLCTLPQNPQALFVKKIVREDIMDVLKGNGLSKEENEKRAEAIVRLCCLSGLLERHPYDISGGEQQRAALAKVLLMEPRVLLLDEPTKGLDAQFKQVFAGILERLSERGVTIIMVSHDVEFCARYAHRCAMFFDGSIVAEDNPRAFFSGNSFYTTAANRMSRHLLPGAVTAEDVIYACGGDAPVSSQHPEDDSGTYYNDSGAITTCAAPSTLEKESRKLSKRTVAAALMILLAIPLTIFFGVYCLGDRKYYFIFMLVMLEAMLPFVLVFEGRKPQARELIIIAVLCAIGVAGRAAFFMLPQFKPVAAIVIISGVAFGGETGFLVGAVTMLVSNIMFSQGPWTPWQMFAMGVIGYLAGIVFRKGCLRANRLSLCIFGGLATLMIYGGIMNPSSVIMYQASPTLLMFLSAYATGLPFDLIHAAATVTFLWFLSKPMLEKLERVKVKYGLVEPDQY